MLSEAIYAPTIVPRCSSAKAFSRGIQGRFVVASALNLVENVEVGNDL